MTDEIDSVQTPEADESPVGRARRSERRLKQKKPPWMPRFVVYSFLMFAAFGLGVLLFNSVIMPAFVGHKDVVKIPDATGKELQAAESLVARSGLTLGETRRRHDNRPAGTVIAQHPAPGTSVKNRRSIILVVSLGEQGSTVPELTGESLRNVEIALGQADLTVGEVYNVFSSKIPPDAVIATEPPAGVGAARGTAVHILMSTGGRSAGYQMPDLRGLDATEMERRLRDVNFQVEVESRGGALSGRRRISDHNPEPGARVWPGRKITLYTD